MNIAAACRIAFSLSLLATAVGCDQGSAPAGASSASPGNKGVTPTKSAAAPAVTATAAATAAAGKVASCNVIKAESLCRQYASQNIEAAGADFLKSTCDGLKGEFKMEACPNDKRVGSCVTQEGTKVFYSTGGLPLAPAKAEKQCKEGAPGEWKPGA